LCVHKTLYKSERGFFPLASSSSVPLTLSLCQGPRNIKTTTIAKNATAGHFFASFTYSSLRIRRSILPAALFGSESTNRTPAAIRLYGATRSSTNPITSRSPTTGCSGSSTTNASGASPVRSSGTPITAASTTLGCVLSSPSSSAGGTWNESVTVSSLTTTIVIAMFTYHQNRQGNEPNGQRERRKIMYATESNTSFIFNHDDPSSPTKLREQDVRSNIGCFGAQQPNEAFQRRDVHWNPHNRPTQWRPLDGNVCTTFSLLSIERGNSLGNTRWCFARAQINILNTTILAAEKFRDFFNICSQVS